MSSLRKKDAPIPSGAPKSLLMDLHRSYIVKYAEDKEEFEYVMSEFLRTSAIYWGLTTLDLMHCKDDLDHNEILDHLKSCHDGRSGGYSASSNHDPHILYTLSAVQVAVTLDRLDVLNVDGIVTYVSNLQNDDGSFCGDKWGEVDARFSFCAVMTLSLLKRMDAINVDSAVDFINRCQNFDGGFGNSPGSESHAGLIYCCVGFLAITHRLDLVEPDLLGWWLAERQLKNGGLNGRPEKLPDVCYSWWVLSSLTILGRLHWLDCSKLTEFILASQDDEIGGISDRPGDLADPFHTLFGLAGLSMMGERRLKKVNPVFCMAQEVIDRLDLKPQILHV